MLDRISAAAHRKQARVKAGTIFDLVGRRSYGPLLLLAGLIMIAPVVGDIPGVPTMLGLFVFLISAQLLLRRGHFWLPRWLLERSVARDQVNKMVRWCRRPARFVDRLLRPRLPVFTGSAAHYAIAVVGLVIALGTPVMEFVPFSANFAGAALLAFGLALVAHDGLLGLIAFILSAATLGFVAYGVFW